jgi:hypothetical protein
VIRFMGFLMILFGGAAVVSYQRWSDELFRRYYWLPAWTRTPFQTFYILVGVVTAMVGFSLLAGLLPE